MCPIEGFVYGVFGGFAMELLGFYKIRHEARSPDWLKSLLFWIPTILMILSGGILVVIYLKSNFWLNAILAVNVGASAP